MSSKKLALPDEIQALVDKIVNAYLRDFSDGTEDLNVLCDWLEGDGWDCFLQEATDMIALDIDAIASVHDFDDNTAAAYMGLDLDELTDEDRIWWGRNKIDEKVEETGDYPSVFEFPLVSSDGKTVTLGCSVVIQGQYGPECSWEGLWKEEGGYFETLSTSYWVRSGFEYDDALDSMILKAWKTV